MVNTLRHYIDDIFHNPGYLLLQLKRRKSRIRYFVTIFIVFWRTVFSEYALNHCITRSSSLAYVLLLAIIPSVATVAFMIAGFVEVQAEQVKTFFSFLLPFAPETLLVHIGTFFVNAKKIQGIGVAFLIAVSIGLFGSVEESFNTIWKVTHSRSFFLRIRSFTMVMVYSPILIILSFQIRRSLQVDLLSDTFLPLDYVPPLLMALAFTSLIILVPNTRVDFKAALAGGFFSGILFEIERQIFTKFLMMSIQAQTIYGTFGILPLFLGSLFIAALIILFGAQCTYVLQHFKPLLRAKKRWDRRVGDYKTYITFRIFLDCVEAFFRKRHPPELLFFCKRYELTDAQASGILNWLIHEGFLHEIKSVKETYIPTRDFSQTPAVVIIDAIENQNRRVTEMPDDSAKKIIGSLLEDLSRQATSMLGHLTIQNLLERMDLERNSPEYHQSAIQT